MEIPPALIRQVSEGKVVLVLGAGASIGAGHPPGRRAPVGQELAKLISQQFLGGAYDTQPLSTVAELAISETDLFTVQTFIRGIFEPFRPADFHRKMADFNWFGIATVNYDLIVERAFEGNPLRQLQPILSNRDRFEEFRRSPKDLLLLKLHGCITRINDANLPLILTPDQYVTHQAGRSRLFEVLEGWAREFALIFVGATLGDSDIRQLLLKISVDEPSRPRFYLVTPGATSQVKRFWESKKITVLDGTFEGFVGDLGRSVTGILRALPIAAPRMPFFETLKNPDAALTESTLELLRSNVTYVHPGLGTTVIDPKEFYRGYSQAWAAIQQNLDCAREIAYQIALDVFLEEKDEQGPELYVIKAGAGAGKTILLHRLAWTAACELKKMCLFADRGAGLSPEGLAEIAELMPERLYLFIDDAADYADDIEALLERSRHLKIPLTVITAERTNEWNVACDDLQSMVTDEFELKYLNDKEIRTLLDLLAKYDALGTLKTKDRASQELAFQKEAGRQLLVALHEATLGKPFEEIVQDEYESITSQQARDIYLTVCTLNRTGIPVRAGLISRVHGVTFDDFKTKFFRPLEHVVYTQMGRGNYDNEYKARHPHVAEIVFRQVLNTQEKRYETFVRIISALLVTYETDRDSLKELTKAKTLREFFSDHLLIEEIFKAAEERVPDEGHVALQHALYEMRRSGGNPDRVAELLVRAGELLPHNAIVSHSLAELELVRAEKAGVPIVRERHLKEAESLALSLAGKRARNAYGYHTLFKIAHQRLKDALGDPAAGDEVIDNAIRTVENRLAEGLQQFPEDDYLLSAESELARTLNDDARALAALERSVAANLRSPNTVARLAKIYIDNQEYVKARSLLEKALENAGFDKKLNFLYARLLQTTRGDGLAIEKHFRRAFTEGDRNLDAYFNYCRQLYINGKIDEARARFGDLKNERMSPMLRFKPRALWSDDSGSPRIFSGRISRVEFTFAIIERDATSDTVIVRRGSPGFAVVQSLSRGRRVKFSIAFDFHGPVAYDVAPETSSAIGMGGRSPQPS